MGNKRNIIVSEGDKPNVKFRIIRGQTTANNLSEGECSLISFCYFIAKMSDELKNEAARQNLVIYIDDPISSLDTNHIFYMFSLIETVIAKPKKYGQLFISTHNLDFLKYLQKLTIPKYKPQPNSNKEKYDINHFLIERKSHASTKLRIAPTYLKDHVTEYNYLFQQIHKCSTAEGYDLDIYYTYNFGNNMRKFLEAYLFYKYPSQRLSLEQRLSKFFDGDPVTVTLINRVINEFSHLEDRADRALIPIDIEEIKKISIAVIEKIKKHDAHQYDAFLESVA